MKNNKLLIDKEIPKNCLDCKHSGTVLCSLGIEDKLLFSSHKSGMILKKGKSIFLEGKYPKGIFALYDGKVKISKIGDEGKEQIVRFAKSGDLIGYRALLSEEAYRATATALSDVRICHIPKTDFFEVLTTNRMLYKDIIKKLASDLRKAENRIISISQKSVKQRIAESLIILHHEFGSKVNQSIDVRLTRKEIGNIAGSTLETTIRTLSAFKKEGVIEFDGKEIIVKDIAKLINIANFKFSN